MTWPILLDTFNFTSSYGEGWGYSNINIQKFNHADRITYWANIEPQSYRSPWTFPTGKLEPNLNRKLPQ